MPSEQDSQPKPAKRARTSFTAEQLQVPERAGGRARGAWEWPGAPRGGEPAPQGDGAELRCLGRGLRAVGSHWAGVRASPPARR